MGVDFNTRTGDSEAGAQVAGFGNSCGFSRIMAEKRTACPFSFFVCFFLAWKTSYRTLILDTHQISPLFRNDMKHVFVEHRHEHGIHLRFLLISMVFIGSSKWVFELVKKSPGDFWEYGVYLSPHRESAMKGIRNSFLFRLVVKGGIAVVGATLQLYGCFLKQS